MNVITRIAALAAVSLSCLSYCCQDAAAQLSEDAPAPRANTHAASPISRPHGNPMPADVEMGRPYFESWSGVLAHVERLLKIIVIVFAAIWAYFKFVKGRVFKPRLDLRVCGETELIAAGRLAVARVTLKNVGLSKVQLSQAGTAVQISGPADIRAIPIVWDGKAIFQVFEDHPWIEPGEVLVESHAVIVDESIDAFRFEARVVAENKEWNAFEICTGANRNNTTLKED
ncbi:MAG TPA: hypothetical protein VMY42_24600 [Thermoguttaceae bacterium]|nr:hypothetical protein [Thermoguttaceae bacterium]